MYTWVLMFHNKERGANVAQGVHPALHFKREDMDKNEIEGVIMNTAQSLFGQGVQLVEHVDPSLGTQIGIVNAEGNVGLVVVTGKNKVKALQAMAVCLKVLAS